MPDPTDTSGQTTDELIATLSSVGYGVYFCKSDNHLEVYVELDCREGNHSIDYGTGLTAREALNNLYAKLAPEIRRGNWCH
jgi:hypothetical protein